MGRFKITIPQLDIITYQEDTQSIDNCLIGDLTIDNKIYHIVRKDIISKWKVTSVDDQLLQESYDIDIQYEQYFKKLFNDTNSGWLHYLEGDLPLLLMIKKTGHTHIECFHVVSEDPFDSGYETMTREQIYQKYKIQL